MSELTDVKLTVGMKVVNSPEHIAALAVIMFDAEVPEPEEKPEGWRSVWEKLFGDKGGEKSWWDLTDDEKAPYLAEAAEIIKHFKVTPRREMNVTV